ncbi:hypothetical protein CBL_06195 [Carabus blaptoides fortunei]
MIKLVIWLTLIIIYSSVTDSYGIHKNKVINCQTYSAQLRAVTSVLCTNIGRTNLTIINACNNCFTAASVANQNQPSLTQLLACANTYLTGTTYASCIAILSSDATALSGVVTTGCVTGYCNFVRCVRRGNSDVLISTCFNEAALINNQANDASRIMLYKNITSCILARARCNAVNPITGQRQNNRYTVTTSTGYGRNTLVTQLYNTLQITPSGDLQIVALPGTTTAATQFCSSRTSLAQSGWTNVTCI